MFDRLGISGALGMWSRLMAKQKTPPLPSLSGKPLRYLIGTDAPGPGSDDAIVEVSYTVTHPPARGIAIAYCNLFDEENTGNYGPYRHKSDTAAEYNEGEIDPAGKGWEKNLREQFTRRVAQGFKIVELDNPDAYSIDQVVGAVDLAASYGLQVVAKNPGAMDDEPLRYVAHKAVVGIIVEKGAGDPLGMDELRRSANKPNLPVWFVAFGDGNKWAKRTSTLAVRFKNMGVTYSSRGEYENAVDYLRPVAPDA